MNEAVTDTLRSAMNTHVARENEWYAQDSKGRWVVIAAGRARRFSACAERAHVRWAR